MFVLPFSPLFLLLPLFVCSSHIGPMSGRVWCMEVPTLALRSVTWKRAVCCWWPRQDDLLTCWNVVVWVLILSGEQAYMK